MRLSSPVLSSAVRRGSLFLSLLPRSDSTPGGRCSSCGPAVCWRPSASALQVTPPGTHRHRCRSVAHGYSNDASPTVIRLSEQNFQLLLSLQMDVPGVLQQVPPPALRASEPGSGPGLVPASPARADPGPGPVLLWEDEGVFPSRAGGSPGEAESREAARSRCDHPEPGQRVAGAGSIHPVPAGSRHHSEVLQGGSGQTVGGGCLSRRGSGSKFHTFRFRTVPHGKNLYEHKCFYLCQINAPIEHSTVFL